MLSADRNVQVSVLALCSVGTVQRHCGGGTVHVDRTPRQGISLQAGPAPVLGPYSAIGRFWLTCGAPTALAAGSAVSYCTRNTTLRPCCPKCPRTASTGRAGGRTSASASACASAAAVCWETLPAIPACIRRTSVKRSRSASPRKRLGRAASRITALSHIGRSACGLAIVFVLVPVTSAAGRGYRWWTNLLGLL